MILEGYARMQGYYDNCCKCEHHIWQAERNLPLMLEQVVYSDDLRNDTIVPFTDTIVP